MLERGTVVPAEQAFGPPGPGGLGGVTGGVPGGFPPPSGVCPLLPLLSVPPAATAEGTTSSTGCPTSPASSTAWSRSTDPAVKVTVSDTGAPPCTSWGIGAPRY